MFLTYHIVLISPKAIFFKLEQSMGTKLRNVKIFSFVVFVNQQLVCQRFNYLIKRIFL
jgi:hypothetical protein